MERPNFYLVWREGCDGRSPTYKHPTYESAKEECKRLTQAHGGKFHVLAHVATAEKIEIKFTEINRDEIPF